MPSRINASAAASFQAAVLCRKVRHLTLMVRQNTIDRLGARKTKKRPVQEVDKLTRRGDTMNNRFTSPSWTGRRAAALLAVTFATLFSVGVAHAQSAAKTAVDAAKKICAGKTITIVWEAGLQSLDPINFSG